MIYELKDTKKVEKIFEGWKETLIYSCLQKVMGKIFVTNLDNPKSAFAYIGCFGFYAGEVNEELVKFKPNGFTILTPQNNEWATLIEKIYPNAKKSIRYAIKKDTKFNIEYLNSNIQKLPSGYTISKIDENVYDLCLKNSITVDFVSSFETKEQFLKLGRGFVIIKDNKIVSGASSYSRYLEGIEIEVDTIESERRKHLALISCSTLILSCIEDGLYPSWDAQNMDSVHLAEKLGYEFDHEYIVYEIE